MSDTSSDEAPGSERHTRGRFAGRSHLACVAAIVVTALVWFSPLFAGSSFSAVPGYQDAVYPWAAHNNGQAFYPQSDQAALNFPWQSALTLDLRQGTVPLWNPESFGGQPLYADGSSALLYPPRLLLAEVVSPRTAHNALSVFHVTFGGLFMYWLLVDLELSPLAALLGAVAWMFGSFTLAWLQLEVVAPVFTWLPAGLVTMRRSVLRSWRWSVAAGGCIALLFVSSHLLFADISVVTICLYGVALALRGVVARRRSGPRRVLGPPVRVAVTAALGVGLAAFVLVPTALSLSSVSRQPLTFSQLSHGMLLPLSALRYALWPASLPVTENEMNIDLAFAGTLTLVCAVIGLVARRKGSGLGRGLVVGSVAVAVGGPVTWLAFTLIPGMSVFRPYSRLLFLFDLGLAVLGAVGLDVVMGLVATPRKLAVPGATSARDARGGDGRTRRWWVSRGLGVAVVGLTALQLGQYGREVNPPFLPSTPALSMPVTPLIRALQAGGGGVAGWPDRVLPANHSDGGWQPPMLDAADPLVFGIASANGYDSAVPTRTVDLWRVVGGEAPAQVIATKLGSAFDPIFDVSRVRFDLLPRLGVDRIAVTPQVAAVPALVRRIESSGWKTVYTGADGTVFAWQGPATGPVVVFDTTHVSSDAAGLARFTGAGFDYRRHVVLDAPGRGSRHQGTARILSAHEGVNTATVRVRSSAPGFLVVPDMWDAGWSATVNGSSATVQRGDFNEQVVRVPAGVSVVSLRYRPAGMSEGVVLSIAAAVAALAMLVAPVLRRRRARVPVRPRIRTGPLAAGVAGGEGTARKPAAVATAADGARRAGRVTPAPGSR